MRVGAIDCGTNSIRLLIADIDPATYAVRDIVRRMEVVRLGYGVDRTGRLDPERIVATLAMCREYAAQCREHGTVAIRFAATSASRDASNAAVFVEGVQDAFGDLGVTPEVISGAEEAALSFRGATGDLHAAGIPGPYLVVDIGGGSTEFVLGTTDVDASLSTDVGCVRLTERHLRSDPPTEAEVAAARADVEAAINAAADVVPLDRTATLVGLAGSVTTVTAHALALAAYEPTAIHLSTMDAAAMHAACDDLIAMSRADRAALPFMHPGRVDVIGGGALVWRTVIDRVVAAAGEVPIVTSEHDILDGIALSLVPRPIVP
ncbi:MAG: exopolyphosphatase [Tetrasphaera jenkinsii]|jgi:exopolyphosphatase / guanosine-5'-triphosphate,3'-diphosphate pyrophosphatase|uniref:Putative exopolyphosphatase Ppx/GppA phosphatase n=1 Tax=Nostocoides jenkinsii Ben 74 TaxID=1193518 RepID=A0A077MFD7_9MICO|nr:exopolyphosphatase [Tetrasphaera jenkinsii]MCI1263035.1 exopolyphosphatase [Tetrasphaera jenkinsii]CCI53828.1 putative exopolyphosphatase Ppx/GppA phosphatase [Tetrasphaera jenkinsii Ben 74]